MKTRAIAAARSQPRVECATARRRQAGRALAKPVVWVLLALVLAAVAGGVWWWKTQAAGTGAGRVGSASGAADGGMPGGPPGGPGGGFGGPGGAGGGGGGPGGGAAGAGGRRFAGGANRTQPVSVARVRRQDIRVTVQAIGSITASNTAIVRAQVSGVLQRLNFKEGQQVKAGQVLAQIDPRVFQAALDQAAGNLARDKAQLENARVDLERYRDLLTKDAVPKQQLDTQQALVRQLEGTIKVDQAAVDSARLQLSYSRVTAPISGRVGLKQVDLGNVVTPSDANGVVVITQTRPIALTFAVPSQHVPLIVERLHDKEPLPVEAWDRSGSKRLAVGTLATLDNSIDVTTDTIKLKALFANTDDALFPNQAVSVRLQLATQSDVLAVPQAAVLRGAQGFYVYIVNADNSVSMRTVKPGAVDADWTAVDGRLQPGEQVVIDGVDRLRDGAKVEVIAADPRQRAGASAPAGGRRGGRGGWGASGASGAGHGGPGGAGYGAGGPPATGRPASGPEPATPADAALRYRPPGAASQPRAASAAANGGGEERPAWMDRLPPEVADKLMKMSPDERREWIRKRREERARNSDGG